MSNFITQDTIISAPYKAPPRFTRACACRLAARVASPRSGDALVDSRAGPPQHIQQRGSGGIEADVMDFHIGAWEGGGGGEPEGSR